MLTLGASNENISNGEVSDKLTQSGILAVQKQAWDLQPSKQQCELFLFLSDK